MSYIPVTHPTPIQNRPSPMEDAIVQQVDWYMGKVNLPTDEFLKAQLDDDLWVDLSVILGFPKMKRMGVTDKARVATLLHARSVMVEVDEKNARIRPAWARRSYLIMSNLPLNTRLDQLLSLFQAQMTTPSTSQDGSSTPTTPSSTPLTHPSYLPGLVSVQQNNSNTWYAVFDTPTGAQSALPFVTDKQINGVAPSLEIFHDNPLQQSTDAFQSPSVARQQPYQTISQAPTPYTSTNGRPISSDSPTMPYPMMSTPMMSTPMMSPQVVTSSMMSPMGMPVPVMHHSSHDIHPTQYSPYPPHASYVPPGYAPQSVSVPRQYINPRALGPGGYIMPYPQHGHPYDPSQAISPNADNQHPGQVVQQSTQSSAHQAAQSHHVDDQNGLTTKNVRQGEQTGSDSTVDTIGLPEGTTDQSSTNPLLESTAIAMNENTAVDRTSSQALVTDPESESIGNGITSDPVTGVSSLSLDPSGHVGDQSVSHNLPHISYSADMPIAMMPGQQMDPNLMNMQGIRDHDMNTHGKAMGAHYIYHGNPIGDINTSGMMPSGYGRPSGRNHQGMLGRDRGGPRDGNNRSGGRNSTVDGNRVPNTNRKGKKGNRNQTRHGHNTGHDRHDGRNRDGKGDGSGSDSGHRDGRGYREEKSKPEPNLNWKHFPPLPMSDNVSSRNGQPKVQKRQSKEMKESKSKSSSNDDIKTVDVTTLNNDDNTKQMMEKSDSSNIEIGPKSCDGSSCSSIVGGTDMKDGNSSNVTGIVDGSTDEKVNTPGIGSTMDSSKHNNNVDESNNNSGLMKNDKKNVVVEHSGTTTSNSQMSYAEILRSKKPSSSRTTVSPRGGAESLKSNENQSSIESGNGGGVNTGHNNNNMNNNGNNNNQTSNGKDRNPRRKKSHNGRSNNGGGHNDVEKKESEIMNHSNGIIEKNNQDGSDKEMNLGSSSSGYIGNQQSDIQKSKMDHGSNTSRAHSVWVNKPKSLFQARPSMKVKEEVNEVERQREQSITNSNTNANANGNGMEMKGKEIDQAFESANKEVGNDEMNDNKDDKNDRNHLPRMGAWAAGGPKQWPKSEKSIEG